MDWKQRKSGLVSGNLMMIWQEYPRKDIKGYTYVLSRVYFETEYGRTDHVINCTGGLDKRVDIWIERKLKYKENSRFGDSEKDERASSTISPAIFIRQTVANFKINFLL